MPSASRFFRKKAPQKTFNLLRTKPCVELHGYKFTLNYALRRRGGACSSRLMNDHKTLMGKEKNAYTSRREEAWGSPKRACELWGFRACPSPTVLRCRLSCSREGICNRLKISNSPLNRNLYDNHRKRGENDQESEIEG